MALTDGLIAYWTMDETSGTRADSTGSGHTLSPTGTVGFATGIIDDAASFSGTGFLEDPGTMIASGSFSISGWYYGNWSGSNYTAFCQMEDGSDWDFKLTFTEEGLLSFSSTLGEVTTPTPSANEWHHIVVTFLDTGTARIYVDGSLVQSGSIGSSIYLGGNNTFWVGTRDSFSEPYTGRIDETGVWTRVLTAEEASALYNGGAGLPYPLELPPPENTVAPAVTGTAQVGQTLTTTNGTWTGSPSSYAYQWKRADDSGFTTNVTNIGTDQDTFVLTASELSKYVRCVVTATNAGGSTPANSNITSQVLPAAPTNSVVPSCSPTSGTTADTFEFDSGTWQNTPTSWSWEYRTAGSGSWTEFSTDENPSILGSVFGVGEWDTRLTATNAGGSSSPATGDTITVASAVSAPVASFTSSPENGTAPLSVTFTDTSTNDPTEWLWEYSQADTWQTFSHSQNPTRTFTAGTWNVRLTATNSAGSNTVTRTGCVPVAAQSMPPSSLVFMGL